jgi:creatinine amidohydrolase
MDEYILFRITKPKTLFEMTRSEAEALFKQTDIGIVVCGSTEQHGPHLPMGTDTLEGIENVKRAARLLEKENIKVVIATPIPFGISYQHIVWPGTISVRPETLVNLIVDVCESLIAHGIKKIVLVLGHTGQHELACLHNATIYIQRKYGVIVSIFDRSKYYPIIKPKVLKSEKPLAEDHAGEHETSMILAICPDFVLMDKAQKFFPPEKEKTSPLIIKPKPYKKFASGVTVFGQLYGALEDSFVAGIGSVGDPTVATKETGEKLFDYFAYELANLIRELAKINV